MTEAFLFDVMTYMSASLAHFLHNLFCGYIVFKRRCLDVPLFSVSGHLFILLILSNLSI